MVLLADIKKDLPAWPDNVIKQCLVHLANRDSTGWPPPEPLGQPMDLHSRSSPALLVEGSDLGAEVYGLQLF